jgi:hypothetical protein
MNVQGAGGNKPGRPSVTLFQNKRGETRLQINMNYDTALAVAAGDEDKLEWLRSLIENVMHKSEDRSE